MQRHPELEEQYAVVHSINGDGKKRSRQDRQAVDGNSTAADGVDIDGAVLERNLQDEVTAAVTMITDHRADIEQAKGMLMLIHGIADPQAAFELLRWRSQETNTKLRVLARQVISDFVGVSGRETLPTQTTYDKLFLTAHLRVESGAESEENTG
jgi:ANTAR domain